MFASLDRIGSVEGPGYQPDSPRHIAIESENFLALGLLVDLYEGQVDCIYIDPPYNTGSTDWKYNNRFVDASDSYRHSKWLSMMQRRLELAEKLLKPDGVLVVTIDENEVHHLAVLLEQMFPTATHQLVTAVITHSGNDRGTFARVEEHAFFVFMADQPNICKLSDDMLTGDASAGNKPPLTKAIRWPSVLRSGNNSRPQDRPGLVYPIWLDPNTNQIIDTGRTLSERRDTGEVGSDSASLDAFVPPSEPPPQPGAVAVWPRTGAGALACWSLNPSTLLAKAIEGHAYASHTGKRWAFSYLSDPQVAQLRRGELVEVGRDPTTGAVELKPQARASRPRTVWHRTRHDAGRYGTTVLRDLLGEKRFDFPKSLYSTLDAIAAIVADRPNALIVDFFAGSGTTLHAVAALNAADKGYRRCVLVSNDDVSTGETKTLRKEGKTAGDPEWDEQGIFRHVLMPRVKAAVTGNRVDGSPVPGKYLPPLYERKFSEGLPAAVEFFKLVCRDPQLLASGDAFDDIHPLLWAQSSGFGPCPTSTLGGYETVRGHDPGWLLPGDGTIPEPCRYNVLLRPARLSGFINAITNHPDIKHVWTEAADRDEFTYIKQELNQLKPSMVVRWLFQERYRRFIAGGS